MAQRIIEDVTRNMTFISLLDILPKPVFVNYTECIREINCIMDGEDMGENNLIISHSYSVEITKIRDKYISLVLLWRQILGIYIDMDKRNRKDIKQFYINRLTDILNSIDEITKKFHEWVIPIACTIEYNKRKTP